jgi:hypothetical protein
MIVVSLQDQRSTQNGWRGELFHPYAYMLVLGSTYVHIGWDKVDSFNAIQWQMKVVPPINK